MMSGMNSSFLWYEWSCHSNFSFCLGASHPEDYVQRAFELGYGGLGLCDYDGVYGLVRGYSQHQRILKELDQREPPPTQQLKLFFGAELHLQADHARPPVYRDSLILYALNRQGYQSLCHILTLAHRHSKREAFLSLEDLCSISAENLLCLQPMRGLIRRSPLETVGKRYARLKEHFGENFYLLLSRHLNPIEDRWILPTLQLGQELSIPCLFSQDAYFHEPGSKDMSDILQAIRLNQPLDCIVPYLFVNSERCLQPLPLLLKRYSCFTEAERILRRSERLAESFDFSLKELRYQYPQELLPIGYTAQDYLEELSWQAAAQHYRGNIPPAVKQLLLRELSLVAQLDFADYFLTVADIVGWARRQGILCQGRGSAANSSICFVLGITVLDPQDFDMLFERFINAERGDPPDIDVDFEHERREEVLQYVYERYGRHRAAMIGNVVAFRSRSAWRSVGKGLGLSEEHIRQAVQLRARHYGHPRLSPNPSAEPSSQEALTPAPLSPEVPWQLWEKLASRLEGFPQHMGIHSGGFVITQASLDALCAQEPATMPGRTVIQWNKDDIEELGIFKIDLLALGMLTVLRKSLELIERHQQLRLDLKDLPSNDPATYQMIQRADTVGTFQIESRAQMSMLPRLRPRCFYDLVIQVGIIRPGPIQGGLIHPYLRRRRGLEPVIYPDERFKPFLQRTLGIPIFQEQIMRLAILAGDFSPGEADQLRKYIGSWSIQKSWGPLVQRLEQGMRRNGIKEQFIEQILGYLKGFAEYGFPESHAASFARLAYLSSYLKCHHQEAFYTALLNSQPVGFYSIHALVQSARREGTRVLPIDVRFSKWDSDLEALGVGSARSLAIRLGLRLVKGLTQKGAEQLLHARVQTGGQAWADFGRFLQASGLSRSDLTALAAADALVGFGLERRSALWIAEGVPYAPLLDQEEPFDFGRESELQRLERDFDSFATTLGEHPAKLLRERHWSYEVPASRLSLARDLLHLPPRRQVYVFGLVLVRQSPMTAKGMLFFTLEDDTGYINLVFTPEKAAAFKGIIQAQGLICASGRLQREGEGHSILVERVYLPRLDELKPIPLYPVKTSDAAEPEELRLTIQEAPLQKLPPARNYH